MRIAIGIAVAALASASFWSFALAEPATQNRTAPVAATEDCRKVGNEVSALIDNRATSPNLPSARAVFQVGIMECMDGDEIAANTHYQQAKDLLNGRPATAPAPAAHVPAKN